MEEHMRHSNDSVESIAVPRGRDERRGGSFSGSRTHECSLSYVLDRHGELSYALHCVV